MGLATHRECLDGMAQPVVQSGQTNPPPAQNTASSSSQNHSQPPPPSLDTGSGASQGQSQLQPSTNQGMYVQVDMCPLSVTLDLAFDEHGLLRIWTTKILD